MTRPPRVPQPSAGGIQNCKLQNLPLILMWWLTNGLQVNIVELHFNPVQQWAHLLTVITTNLFINWTEQEEQQQLWFTWSCLLTDSQYHHLIAEWAPVPSIHDNLAFLGLRHYFFNLSSRTGGQTAGLDGAIPRILPSTGETSVPNQYNGSNLLKLQSQPTTVSSMPRMKLCMLSGSPGPCCSPSQMWTLF